MINGEIRDENGNEMGIRMGIKVDKMGIEWEGSGNKNGNKMGIRWE